MKRRIAIDQIEAGMYLVGFEGFWLFHPFWRTKFVLTKADVSEIRASGVKAVFIDDEKGAAPICVTAPIPPAPLTPPPAPAKRMEAARHWRSFPAPSPSPRRLIVDVDEVQRATEAIQRSKRVIMRMFGEARMGKAVALRDVEPIIDEIAESVIRDAAAMIKVTRLKRKNEYTYLHSVAVCALMINLGRQLGLAESLTRDLGMAGLMHDIGKMAVPGTVLDKPGSLNNDEFEIIRAHPQKGHELLLMTEGISPIALDVCLHHHERVDGTGYPFGLTAEQLSLHARMGAVCDVYDAVTSRRPYKDPWTPSDALAKMLEWEGHFDPDVLDAFISSIGIYPVGTLVRLRTNRLGIVVAGNAREPTMPAMRAFFSTTEREFLPPEIVICSATLKGDAAIGIENGEAWFGPRWPVIQAFVLDNRMPTADLIGAGQANIASPGMDQRRFAARN